MPRIPWGNKQQVIYKHAISTMVPLHPVDLTEE
ncbi:MAG: RNA chaperone Hfq [Oscillibacter sp.]